MNEKKQRPLDRRDFMKASAAAVAGSGLLTASVAEAQAAKEGDGLDHRNEQLDKMAYRKLGRTNFMSSRLVFGCGSALAGGRGVRMLEQSFEAGVNLYDVGTDKYYKGSEGYLAPFINKHRGEVFVVSKAMIREGLLFRAGEQAVDVANAKGHAAYWSKLLDESLVALKTDYVDAYYIMGVDEPAVVKSEEMGNAFLKAKGAGKVGHFGISTHRRAQECLEAAIETGWYDLAMIGLTPAGWYDWITMNLLQGSPGLKELRPLLDRARAAGIGLIGMKVCRHIGMRRKEVAMYDSYYGEKLLSAPLSPFQRAYAYALENGIDVVNADMENFKILEENLQVSKASHLYFA